MKCSRDRSVRVFTDDGKHHRNKCPGCAGLPLGADEVDGAIGPGRVKAALVAARIAELPQSAVSCPRDGTTMRRLDHHGVELDLCTECRCMWLDAGELEKIAASRKRAKRAVATGAAAAVAGGAAIAAAAPGAKASLAGEVAGTVAEIAVDGVLEFAGEALSSLLGGLS